MITIGLFLLLLLWGGYAVMSALDDWFIDREISRFIGPRMPAAVALKRAQEAHRAKFNARHGFGD